MLTIRNYVKVQSLQEAYELNQKKTSCIMGGMMWLRMGNKNIQTMIDLCNLNLDTIEETEEEFSIGAMVTLRQLEKHEGLQKYTEGAIANAVKDIVGVQFRNTATVGGSIFGRFGFSDVMTIFLAMDTYVELYQEGVIPLSQFVTMKRNRDLLVRLIVKKKPAKFTYLTMRNTRTDFPVLTCAVSKIETEYRAVIGARPMIAKIIFDEQHILASGIKEETAEQFAAYVAEHTGAGSNMRGSAAYRTHLAKVLTKRAVLELGGQ